MALLNSTQQQQQQQNVTLNKEKTPYPVVPFSRMEVTMEVQELDMPQEHSSIHSQTLLHCENWKVMYQGLIVQW